MAVSVAIEGLDELRTKFAALSDKQQRGVLRAGIRAGGRVVQRAAKNRAPRDRGDLRGGISVKVSVKAGGAAEADIGYSRDEFYGRFQELGTSHHAAQPFLRPALEESQQEVIDTIADNFRRHIDKVAG